MGGAVVKAAKAVGLEEKEEVKKPVLAGEVEKSIALGRSGLIRNQKRAAVNLCRLAKDSDRVRNQIVDEGGILPIIQMCRSKSQEVQLLAFLTMGQLARTNSNRTKMLENGAVAPLLEGLKHKKYEVRSASVYALGNMGEYEEARLRIISEGACPGLIKFLGEGFRENSLEEEIQCLDAIHKLSQHQKNHMRMVRDNILPILFEIVQSALKSNKHKSLAMQSIAEITKSENTHKKIADFDQVTGVRRIIRLCEYYDDSVRIYAAEAVGNLAQNPVLIQKLTEDDVLHPLKKMLKSEKVNVVLNAVKAVYSLARDPQNQKLIVRENFIPHLLKRTNCGNDEIEQLVVLTICQLARSNVNRPKILFHGGFKPLIYNAQYGKTDELKRVSQDVLSNLFQLPGAKRDELVRRAAEKFKQGLRHRQGEFGSAQNEAKTKNKNKRATAAEIIFAGGGNDEDSSDDDKG
jgi:HEAT repeat protein